MFTRNLLLLPVDNALKMFTPFACWRKAIKPTSAPACFRAIPTVSFGSFYLCVVQREIEVQTENSAPRLSGKICTILGTMITERNQ